MTKVVDVAYIMPIGILAGDSDVMILSSADILRILGGNEVVRLSAKLSIADGKPSLSGREGIYIHVERFPSVQEFEATWSIYIEADEEIDLILAEIKRLLPKVEVEQGLLTTVKTTDFRSESTQTAPEAPKPQTTQIDLTQYEERFQTLVEDVQDRMLLVSSGRPGKDGQDGRNGVNGRDGKDLVATEAELFDLQDVEQGIQMERGQVLTWDGSKWTNLYVRQSMSPGGGGGGSVDNVTIISETAPVEREDGSALLQGDSWYAPSTDQLYLYIDGAWEEIKVDEGASGGVASGFWKFSDKQSEGYDDGKFRVNNHQNKTDWSLTTELYVAYKTDDGANVKNILLNLVQPGQYVYVQRKDRPDAWVILLAEEAPVDADTKGCRIAVSFVSQGVAVADITKDKLCDLSFMVVGSGGGGNSSVIISDHPPTQRDDGSDLEEGDMWWESDSGALYVYYNNAWVQTSGEGGSGVTTLAGLLDTNIDNPQDGQVLAYNASADEWENQPPADTGIPEAPQDGNYYVRQNGEWVSLVSALAALEGVVFDGGNFTTGETQGNTKAVDGGVFT